MDIFLNQNLWMEIVKSELDLPTYAIKTDFKKATGVDISDFANLASLKSDVNELDIDKLKTIPIDLSKLRNLVNDDVVKKR